MAFYADLGTESQVASGPHVRAVGWLSSAHPFPTAAASPEVVARLELFRGRHGDSLDALWWPAAAGPHTCELCSTHMDAQAFGVPAGELIYVCPTMIAHYVKDHDYAPPAEFVAAILRSPEPGTFEYRVAAAPFNSVLGAKSAPIRLLVCRVKAALERDRCIAYPSEAEGPDAIWLGDSNLKGLQTRLRVASLPEAGRFELDLGHNPFHEPRKFKLARRLDAVTVDEVVAVVRAEFAT